MGGGNQSFLGASQAFPARYSHFALTMTLGGLLLPMGETESQLSGSTPRPKSQSQSRAKLGGQVLYLAHYIYLIQTGIRCSSQRGRKAPHITVPFFFFFFSFSCVCVCVCVWPHPRHAEVPGPGIKTRATK